MSGMFKLNARDFAKGAVTAVFAAVIFTVGGLFQQTGFDVFTADWGAILTTAVNAGVAAFVGYMAKNFVTDDGGQVFGSI